MYNEAIVKEILLRGYKNSTQKEFDYVYANNYFSMESEKPWWLGNNRLHYSHKGRLFEKDQEKYYFYSQYSNYKDLGYICCDKCNYFWPTHVKK
jgi:hypothetical protein